MDPVVSCRSSEDRGRGQFSGFVRQHFLVPENQQSPVAKTSGTRPLGDPQLRVTAAKERMAKLEAALAALHGVAPKSRVCEEVKVKECEGFLSTFDRACIRDAEQLLEALKQMQQFSPPLPVHAEAEVPLPR